MTVKAIQLKTSGLPTLCLEKLCLHTCMWTSVHTCADRLLHLDGTDGRFIQRRQNTHVICIEGDTEEGCHGDHSPKPPIKKKKKSKITKIK